MNNFYSFLKQYAGFFEKHPRLIFLSNEANVAFSIVRLFWTDTFSGNAILRSL